MQFDHSVGGILPSRPRLIKAWGWEELVWNTDRYCGKILRVHKRMETSYHYHKVKDETLLVTKGLILFRYNEQIFPLPASREEADQEWVHCVGMTLYPGTAFHVPPFMRHQIRGLEEENEVIEFSTFHDDNDSYRVVAGTDWDVQLTPPRLK